MKTPSNASLKRAKVDNATLERGQATLPNLQITVRPLGFSHSLEAKILNSDKDEEMNKSKSELEASYDRVAEQYADEFFRELERKPFDRELLYAFAESVRTRGEVCEIGCGPGHISRYLQDRGATMRGIDLSREMVKCAQRLNPDISFEQGDMLALTLPDSSVAAIISFYAVI